MEVSCAAEVWLAVALLHREHPDENGFKAQKIVDKAYSLELASRPRPGTVVHATQHCVASKPASPFDFRMLTIIEDNLRRLYREGDPVHPTRREGQVRPKHDEVPEEYHELLDWYDDAYTVEQTARP